MRPQFNFRALLIGLVFCSVLISSAQPPVPVKPIRIGVKAGVPNILSLNLEYVTPAFDYHLALSGDFMTLSQTIDNVDIDFTNYEVGINYYLAKCCKGIYGGISYFSFNGEGTYQDVEYDGNVVDEGTGDIDFTTINVKIGAKLGNTLYFRAEVGYGFGDIPETITVRNSDNTLSTTEDIPDIPGISGSGLPVLNIGFGISF